MALSGVRISWLILARKSDFADDALSAWRLALTQFVLGLLPGRDVAEDRAQPVGPVLDPADRHEQRDQRRPARARPITSRPSSSARTTPGSLQACEMIDRDALAVRREQARERQARKLAALVAEQHLGAAVDRDDAGRRGRTPRRRRPRCRGSRAARPPRPWPAAAPRRSSSDDRRRRCPTPASISTSADSPSHGEVNSRASTGSWSPRLVAMVSALAPLFSPAALLARLDEQRVEPAGLLQRVELPVAGPVEEGAVGVDQLVEPVDQDADRQPVEDRPLVGRRDCARPAGSRRGGRGRLRLRLGRLRRLLGHAGAAAAPVLGAAQSCGEAACELAERLALDRR